MTQSSTHYGDSLAEISKLYGRDDFGRLELSNCTSVLAFDGLAEADPQEQPRFATLKIGEQQGPRLMPVLATHFYFECNQQSGFSESVDFLCVANEKQMNSIFAEMSNRKRADRVLTLGVPTKSADPKQAEGVPAIVQKYANCLIPKISRVLGLEQGRFPVLFVKPAATQVTASYFRISYEGPTAPAESTLHAEVTTSLT